MLLNVPNLHLGTFKGVLLIFESCLSSKEWNRNKELLSILNNYSDKQLSIDEFSHKLKQQQLITELQQLKNKVKD